MLNAFPFDVEPGAFGKGLQRPHLSACRKGSTEDYYTGLSGLRERPAVTDMAGYIYDSRPDQRSGESQRDLPPYRPQRARAGGPGEIQIPDTGL